MVEEGKLVEAEKAIVSAKKAYQKAQVLSPNADDHPMHHLYKLPTATTHDLALSGVADTLHQAKLEQVKKERDEQSRHEAQQDAQRAAKADQEKFERQKLEKIQAAHGNFNAKRLETAKKEQ
eukprot:CAMPEP_0173407840 /NCGR_PEP_ID=MMETSP1356-20130122/68200_1 /TAXON_ID=77927 ORGANISM="Hemiselmis virescens, Strain PCC157" /NCGR_SAMPLE_ID=MMETSP1356 /ASSEMBLY_ACC=CAM_ASM_000847 /LENGTH=121 /DNA_ID=CAMNT_0014369065 /DNA_START=48 /DNA_END=410 /DNA_ORIENTATION=-